MKTMDKHARHKARSLMVQLLYQWQVTHDDYQSLVAQATTWLGPRQADMAYLQTTLAGCLHHQTELMDLITQLAQRESQQLALVEKAVLLLALYEMQFIPDLPYQIIINEAIELDKKFGSAEGYRMVNGVLDQAAKRLRPKEYGKFVRSTDT